METTSYGLQFIFPDLATIERTRPAFLFRDPLRVYDSWKAVGWTDVESLLSAYRNLYHTWAASDESAIAITYEELMSCPEQTIERLCNHWGVKLSQNILSFDSQFGDFLFSSERERQIYSVDNPLGLFNIVESNQSINAEIRSQGLLTMDERNRIEQGLGGMYMDAYEGRLKDVQNTLQRKTHYGFDLDDTLHEFRRASGIASTVVFQFLAEAYSSTVEDLKATYTVILASATSGAFTEGKTADEYRKERFTTLMEAHKMEITDEIMQHLLESYKNSLQAALTLKPGAQELLSILRKLGKEVVLITEGPEDAQQWTLRELGIADNVDTLITSNRYGKTKTDGLFAAALVTLRIKANDFIFIGDNMSRDIEPARAEGIMTIHYSESENVRLQPDGLRVNSHWKLLELLGSTIDISEDWIQAAFKGPEILDGV
ncbi:MAG: hypothetical protein Q9170_005358 [Blastenia crenularia]